MNFDASVLQVPIEDIIPNRFQPRLVFEDSSLNELANSIKQHGIIQPLVLRRIGEKYEIVAGERRYRAAKMAGLVSVPAVISKIDDKESAEIAVSENVQRKELTAIEEAKSYKALLDQGYMTQAQLATKLGLSEVAIANKLRLLTLAPEVQNAILDGKISERHARSLLTVKDPDAQVKWLARVINERLTVRMLDLELRKEYGEVYMNNGLDIDKIKQNATDIPITAPVQPAPAQNEMNIGPINLGSKPTNKFFNTLEDEAVNMQMTEAVNPFLQQTGLFQVPSENEMTPVTPEPEPVPVNNIVNPELIQSGVQPVNMESPQVIEPAFVNATPTPAEVPTSPTMVQQPVPEAVVQAPVTPEPIIDSLDSLDVLPTPSAPVASPQIPVTQEIPQTQNPSVSPSIPVQSTKSINEVKEKVNSLVEELRALGYNVNNTATELNNSASFTIMVNF